MDMRHRESAERLRSAWSAGPVPPALFREALLSVPPAERDAWLDLAFGLEQVLEDGPQLPPSCTPYLPAPVGAVLRAVEHAGLGARDVFVDIGSGVGRAALLAQLWSGAAAIGVEIQPQLAEASRALARRLHVARFSVVEGDAPEVLGHVRHGTVFFLYCPFGGERLERTLQGLADVARGRTIHVCCVQVPPLLELPWLTPLPLPEGELVVYRGASPAG